MIEESQARWEKRVADAEEHAGRVYADEVKHLADQIDATDKKEAREVERVEREVERDADFAAHHVEHLGKVVEREVEKVNCAYDRLAKKAADGASQDALDRAAKHAARVEDDADRHIAKVAERTEEDIERDAKAAARHLYHGLDKLGLDEDHLDKDAVADADRVAAALDNVAKKAE